MIPPLITQPVIENAVWHGLAHLEKKGELRINFSLSDNFLLITVTNTTENGQVSNPGYNKKKSFGMKITKERLTLLKQTTGKEGTIQLEMLPGIAKVTIAIPLKQE